MNYLQGECSYRRAEEEEEIQHGSSACSQLPSCLVGAQRCAREPVYLGDAVGIGGGGGGGGGRRFLLRHDVLLLLRLLARATALFLVEI
jgi:hypothetical protein